MTDSGGESRTIKSVEKTFRLLEALKRADGAGITELSELVPMSRGSIHHYLASLEKHGYVTKRGDRYYVDVRFLALGGYARRHEKLYHESRSKIDELAEETGATSRLVVERQGHCITIYQTSSLDETDVDTYEGFEEAPHTTAAGKAILAELPHSNVEALVEYHGLHARTSNTITDEEELYSVLETVRSRGYAVDDEECFEGVLCVADAITTSDGAVHGALSVSAQVADIDRAEFLESVPPLLNNATGVVEISHTYSGWDNDI